jgi:putative effector of murein hydrolase
MVAVTAWLARGIQLLLGTSKRAMTERAEEMGHEDDSIPLAENRQSRLQSEATLPSGTSTPGLNSGTSTPSTLIEDLVDQLAAPQRTQDPSLIRGTGGPPETESTVRSPTTPNPPSQTPLPLSRPQRWAAFINRNLYRLTWTAIFLFVGLPIYYTTGYAMPAQLTFNVLAYFAALSLPLKWRQFLHPVLVSSLITVLGIWIFGLVRGEDLDDVLHSYKTGTNYLDLWQGNGNLPMPGAGDVFGSVLDAAIVALALPMFSYRQELRRHFFAIVIPNVAISVGSLFGYPVICYAIGISSTRSLAFAGRSLTLALATPATKNLGGDINTNAALAIMSGIMGVLVGQRVLAWLKIPEGESILCSVKGGVDSERSRSSDF